MADYRQEVTTKIEKVETITSDARIYCFDSVNINFSMAVITQYSTEEEGLFAELQEPLITSTVHLSRPIPILTRGFPRRLQFGMRGFVLSSYWKDKVINEIVTFLRAMLEGKVPFTRCNILDVSVQITSTHIYTYNNNNEDNDQLLETTVPRFVPATDSSIQSLEEKKIGCNDDYGSCTICFGEYLPGTQTSCMPCSHQFHPDCIAHWLRISHYCPICQFEMPTL